MLSPNRRAPAQGAAGPICIPACGRAGLAGLGSPRSTACQGGWKESSQRGDRPFICRVWG